VNFSETVREEIENWYHIKGRILKTKTYNGIFKRRSLEKKDFMITKIVIIMATDIIAVHVKRWISLYSSSFFAPNRRAPSNRKAFKIPNCDDWP